MLDLNGRNLSFQGVPSYVDDDGCVRLPYGEADTRAKLIDPALHNRGWTEDHIRREETAGGIEIIEGEAHRASRGRVDYTLRLRINKTAQPLAVAYIEAKAENKPPTQGLEQVKGYQAAAQRLNVPFVYSTNGHLFIEYDHSTGQTSSPKPLSDFPTNEELRRRFEHHKGFDLESENARPLLIPYAGGEATRRYYQDAAIRATFEKLALPGENRALLSLATGAGKTFIAVNLLKRIADAGQLKRALFVCDRDELRTQALAAFSNVFGSDVAEVEAARIAAVAAKADSDKLLDHCLREVFQNIVPLSTNPLNPVTPKGWRWAPLMELARLESGHTPSRRHPEYWEDGDIPWLALPDIRALDCRVAIKTSEQTNLLGIKNSSARVCPEQTVAMCRTASVGYVTILGRPMATSQHFTNWICGEALMPRFLMWLIRASRRFTKSIASGSILPDIYMNVVHNFHVCLPAIETQKKIVARIDAVQAELDQLSNRQNEQLEALNKLPAAYLREAFSK